MSILRSHAWTEWAIGKGVLSDENGDEAIFKGRFNLNTDEGRTGFETLKFQGEIQEWSWGFDPRRGSIKQGELEGEKVSFLGPLDDGSTGAKVYEVSPVLVGSGIDTRTTDLKGIQPGGSGPLDEQVASVLAAVKDLLDRYGSLADLRAEKDRRLGEKHIDTLESLLADLGSLHLKATAPGADDLEVERLRFEADRSSRILAGIAAG